jgi:hypothetical protein
MEFPSETRTDRAVLQRGRRFLPAGLLIAIAAVAIAAWGGRTTPPTRVPDVLLLYVGADDCAPCRAWQKGDGASFIASAEFGRLRYREVKPAHLADVLKDDNWPEELRAYRSQLKRSDGVPLWLVVSDDEIVEQKFGAAAWREAILPKIRSLLRPAST